MKSFVPSIFKKKDDKYMGPRANMKLSSDSVVPFVDLLETLVKKKQKHPSASLKIVDTKQVNEVIDQFLEGFRHRTSLDKSDVSVLWSAVIKIIKQSDPILSDRNCTTLQTASSKEVAQIATYMPVYHQQVLGSIHFPSCFVVF